MNDYNKYHTPEAVKQRGEVFTPEWLVEDMLAKLPQDVLLDTDKTVLDNSCGNGNFLAKVLQLRYEAGKEPISCLRTIYGVELDVDNAEACRDRLIALAVSYGGEHDAAKDIVQNNIITGNGLGPDKIDPELKHLHTGDYWYGEGDEDTPDVTSYGRRRSDEHLKELLKLRKDNAKVSDSTQRVINTFFD